MQIKTKQRLAVLLSLAGSAGTIATAILTRRAAKKETKILNDLEKNPGEEISKKQIVKTLLPVYILPGSVGIATIASIISSTLLSRKAEASLTAMALLADQGWRKYKGVVKSKLGLKEHNDILKTLGKKDYEKVKDIIEDDGKQLYFEEHIGFFRANPELFALAFSDLNQRLQLEEFGVSSRYTMLYDLIQAAEADVLDKELYKKGSCWGWSAEYLKDIQGYIWLHMEMFDTENPTGTKKFKTIVWGQDPYLDPGNSGEYFVGKTPKDKELNQFKSVIPKKQAAVVDHEIE